METHSTGIGDRHIAVGIDIDADCFRIINPFNYTSGREKIPAACFVLLVVLIRVPYLPGNLNTTVGSGENSHDKLPML